MKELKAYLSNQLGFSQTGRYLLDTLIIPRIQKIGIIINEPFEEGKKLIDFNHLKELRLHEEVKRFWEEFNLKVTPANNLLMQNSDCMLAILDGGHVVDDGVASEIGYYAGIKKGPIFALRSDFRGGENIATPINPQVLGYIIESGGKLIDGENALEKWSEAVKEWHDSFK
jgi:hypothetical protein